MTNKIKLKLSKFGKIHATGDKSWSRASGIDTSVKYYGICVRHHGIAYMSYAQKLLLKYIMIQTFQISKQIAVFIDNGDRCLDYL